MLIVHHLENSRSQRVLWLLEELGVPYDIVRYERDPRTMLAPPELRAIHPLGKSPVVVDDGEVMAETGAIIETLLERYGHGRIAPAPGSAGFRRMRYWLHYAEGSAMPPLLLKLVFGRIPSQTPALIRPVAGMIAKGAQDKMIDPQLKTHMDYWESELGRDGWFAGPQFSAADIMMSFPLEAASRAGVRDGRPRVSAWLDAIHAMPSYQRALQHGGPYAYADA